MPDRSSWFVLSLIIILYFIIGFLTSFAESYISSLNEKKLEKDEENEVHGAKEFQSLLKKKQKMIAAFSCVKIFSAIALGITTSVMLYDYLSILFYLVYGRPYGNISGLISSAFCIEIVTGILFYFIAIVFPDRLGFKSAHKENDTYRSLGLIKFISAVDSFLSLPFRWFVSLFFKDESIEDYITEDEILSLVDIGEENGGIDKGEKEMIENVFDFSDIKAVDVMTHRTSVVAIDVETPESEILDLINENEYSRYPVYRDDIDNIIGILNAKKFYSNYISHDKSNLESLLYKPYLVPETIHADSLLEEMQKRKNHMAVVVDEYGGTCGIVTMEDLLEKIVGNIYDETDDPSSEQEIIKISDGRWKIAGTADLHSINDALGINIDEDSDFDTLGGLVFSGLTVIPTDGELPEIETNGLYIKVLSVKDRAVEWAEVTIQRKDDNEDNNEN